DEVVPAARAADRNVADDVIGGAERCCQGETENDDELSHGVNATPVETVSATAFMERSCSISMMASMKKLLLPFLLASVVVCLYGADKPKISMKRARAVALKQVTGGKIESAELENEDGKLIYSFDIRNRSGITEVNVDAMTGKIIAVQKES